MARFKILGSCSGTEPMIDRHHTSIVLEENGRNYFFDAGENAVHTAHTQGIDLTRTRAIFISHSHYDHIGGLMGIFWTMRKLCHLRKTNLADGEVKLFLPETKVWDHIFEVLKHTEGGFKQPFDILVDTPKLGTFYEDENVELTAYESHHLPLSGDGSIRSFSYRIKMRDKTAVFSGDIKDMDDLTETVGEGCDLLLCETGHHEVKAVCEFAESHHVKQLVFVHHGREILENRPSVQEAVDRCKIPVKLAFDGMDIEL
ncbi:MAG: MBL fold metallo-hydrolase [Oscillospiraceae bacterium]|nr:MBL fold metallo-hydrolase [Oscillospiraceae bacterium]